MKRLAAIGVLAALAAGPAVQAAPACLDKTEMRAFTTLFVDKGAEALVDRCLAHHPDAIAYAAKHKAEIAGRFDGLRDQAYSVLIDKFAPFLKGSKMSVAPVIGPIIENFILQNLDNGLTADQCYETDSMVEALAPLPDDKIIAVAEVLLGRHMLREGNAPFVPCAGQ